MLRVITLNKEINAFMTVKIIEGFCWGYVFLPRKGPNAKYIVMYTIPVYTSHNSNCKGSGEKVNIQKINHVVSQKEILQKFSHGGTKITELNEENKKLLFLIPYLLSSLRELRPPCAPCDVFFSSSSSIRVNPCNPRTFFLRVLRGKFP